MNRTEEATQRTLVLDLGGVLLTDGTKTAFEVLAGFHSAPSCAELEQRWQQELRLPAELGEIGSDEVFFTLARWTGLAMTTVEDVVLGEFQPIPQGVTLLQEATARGLKTVLATNHLDEWLRRWEERYPWFGLLDDIVCSSTLGKRKPQGEFYDEVLKVAGNPSNLLFVDDDPVNISGAQACGLPSLLARGDWSSSVEGWLKLPDP